MQEEKTFGDLMTSVIDGRNPSTECMIYNNCYCF